MTSVPVLAHRARTCPTCSPVPGPTADRSAWCRPWGPSTRATPACSAPRAAGSQTVRSWSRSSSTPSSSAPHEDLDRYPRTLDEDLKICEREGVDIVFAPSVDEVYPGGDPQVTIRARSARRGARGQDPPRTLPRRADGGGQALRPGPPGRRGLRREGLPAADPDPADGPRPQPAASRSSAPRPSASTTAWRCPAATATSTPSSAWPAGALSRALRAAAGERRLRRRRRPRRGPRRAARADGVDLDYLVITDPTSASCRAAVPRLGGADPDRRPGRHHPSDRQHAARPRARNQARRHLMLRTMMKSKIHRATVTQADLHYVGSVTVDEDLLDAADLLPGRAGPHRRRHQRRAARDVHDRRRTRLRRDRHQRRRGPPRPPRRPRDPDRLRPDGHRRGTRAPAARRLRRRRQQGARDRLRPGRGALGIRAGPR